MCDVLESQQARLFELTRTDNIIIKILYLCSGCLDDLLSRLKKLVSHTKDKIISTTKHTHTKNNETEKAEHQTGLGKAISASAVADCFPSAKASLAV